MNNPKILFLVGCLLLGIFLTIFFIGNIKNQNTQQRKSSSQATTTTSPTAPQAIAPTSAWKVYTQTTHGFQFTYPSALYANNTTADSVSVNSYNTPADPDAPVTGIQITVTQGNTITDHFDLIKDLFANPTLGDVIVGGMSAKAMSGYGTGVLAGKYIKYVDVLNRGETIQIGYFEGDPQITQATFDQLLTTLKFK
jgi:hypothetical protein